LSKELLTDT